MRRTFWVFGLEAYLCILALLFKFSFPRNDLKITNKKSVPAAKINVMMRKFHDPQRPGCPNLQHRSSFCTTAIADLSEVYSSWKGREHTERLHLLFEVFLALLRV